MDVKRTEAEIKALFEVTRRVSTPTPAQIRTQVLAKLKNLEEKTFSEKWLPRLGWILWPIAAGAAIYYVVQSQIFSKISSEQKPTPQISETISPTGGALPLKPFKDESKKMGGEEYLRSQDLPDSSPYSEDQFDVDGKVNLARKNNGSEWVNLTTPQLLAVTELQKNPKQIEIRWTSLAKIDALKIFEIEASKNQGPYQTIKAANSEAGKSQIPVDLLNLKPKETAVFRLKATYELNENQQTLYSNTILFKASEQKLLPPTQLSLTQSDGTLVLSFTEPKDIKSSDKYQIEISSTSKKEFSPHLSLKSGIKQTVVMSILPKEVTSFRVKTQNEEGLFSEPSEIVSFTPEPRKIPTSPFNLKISLGTEKQVNLSWQVTDSSADQFLIETSSDGVSFAKDRQIEGKLRTLILFTTDQASHLNDAVYVRLTSLNEMGSSQPSETITFDYSLLAGAIQNGVIVKFTSPQSLFIASQGTQTSVVGDAIITYDGPNGKINLGSINTRLVLNPKGSTIDALQSSCASVLLQTSIPGVTKESLVELSVSNLFQNSSGIKVTAVNQPTVSCSQYTRSSTLPSAVGWVYTDHQKEIWSDQSVTEPDQVSGQGGTIVRLIGNRKYTTDFTPQSLAPTSLRLYFLPKSGGIGTVCTQLAQQMNGQTNARFSEFKTEFMAVTNKTNTIMNNNGGPGIVIQATMAGPNLNPEMYCRFTLRR